MGNGRRFRKSVDKAKQSVAPAVRLDGTGMKWGILAAPGIWISSPNAKPPSRWARFWQRVLLGWKWEQR